MRVGVALGVLLVMGGCGHVGDDKAGEQEPIAEWSTAGCAAPRGPAELGSVLNKIEAAGKVAFAESFAGVEVDQERDRAIVYRVPSAAFDEFVRRAAEDVCVVVRDADHSTKDLAAWHDRVLADLPYWTDRGVSIVSIGARHDGTGVEIGVRDAVRARRELLARYGDRAPLIFRPADPVRPLPAPTSRIAPPPNGA